MTPAMIVIGIDPGFWGAVAFLDPFDPSMACVMRTPILTSGTHRTYDIEMMKDLLWWKHQEDCFIVLESVHPFPGQGLSSTGKLMYGMGLWHGLIVGLFGTDRLCLVSPQRWKRQMLGTTRLSATTDKTELRRRAVARKLASVEAARRLFPSVPLRDQDHGMADALLLAEYGRRVRANANQIQANQIQDRPSS